MSSKVKMSKKSIFDEAINGNIDLLVYQANCFLNMHSGFSNGVRKCFGNAFAADQATLIGDKKKLGKYSYGKTFFAKSNHEVIVVNMYSQYSPEINRDVNGNKIPSTNLIALEEALTRIFTRIRRYHPNFKVGIPKIGNEYSGDSWKTIKDIIVRCSKNVDLTIYKTS